MAFETPPLPYAADALEPHIDAKTMTVHHDGHHVAYTNNLNNALKEHPDWQNRSVEDILSHMGSVPESIRLAIQNNGGGYANHNMFWKLLSPTGGGEPTGVFAQTLAENFGSYEKFKEEFVKAATTRFGSGWAWLVMDKQDSLKVISTANQDNPLMDGLTPIMGLDVWEHAYYLKYQNKRADYITAFWNVINWAEVASNYEKAKK